MRITGKKEGVYMSKKTVLVTGASRGIGKALAIKFAKKGYRVVISCVNPAHEDMLEQVQKEIEDYLSQDQRNTVEQEKIEYHLGQLYENYIKTKACNINYYYRYVFNMINFVIGQWIHAENGKAHIHKYLNFIQAQMSDEELALIFYDAISHHGLDNNYSHQFKETIDCYGFLENINPHILLDRSHHIIFPKTKFKFLNRDEKMSKQQ